MKTKHRYEFRTFTVEKENGWVTITDEESGVAVRGAEDKSREDFQCILPHVGYLSNENRVSYTRSILAITNEDMKLIPGGEKVGRLLHMK